MLGADRIVVAEEPAKDKVTLKQFTNFIGMRMVPIKAGFSRASERLCGPPWMPRCAGRGRDAQAARACESQAPIVTLTVSGAADAEANFF
jgi:hypothetical protein